MGKGSSTCIPTASPGAAGDILTVTDQHTKSPGKKSHRARPCGWEVAQLGPGWRPESKTCGLSLQLGRKVSGAWEPAWLLTPLGLGFPFDTHKNLRGPFWFCLWIRYYILIQTHFPGKQNKTRNRI